MISLLLYMGALMLLSYLAVLYASETALLLAGGGVLFAALAYGYLLLQMCSLHFSLSVPVPMTVLGEEAELVVTLKNRFSLPAPRIRLCLSCQNSLFGRKHRVILRGAAGACGETVISGKISGAHCGVQRYRLRRIRVYDLTGIFYLTKRSREEAELVVLPPIYETAVKVTEQARFFMGEAETYDAGLAGWDVTETLQIRPFREGDRIQNIHWKMTVRADELMVREGSLPQSCPVAVLLDFAESGSWRKNPYADGMLTLASSLSCALTAQRCPHYLAWYSSREQDVVRIRISEEEELYLALQMLYEDGREKRSLTGQETLSDRYREKYRAEPSVTEIVLTRGLEITCGGMLFGKMNLEKLEQEIGEVEFIV